VVVVAERRVRLCAARTALDDLDLEHARSLSLLIIPLPAGKLVVQRVRLTQLFFFVVERGNNNSQERDRTTVCPVFFISHLLPRNRTTAKTNAVDLVTYRTA
jgi:hypothetical protein